MRQFTLLILTLLSFVSIAQKEDYNWTFGKRGGIDFSDLNLPSTFVTNSNSFESSATISDSQGRLLFYITVSNDGTIITGAEYGALVYDNNNSIIPNGDSIRGIYQITNDVMIIPDVDRENRYFVFSLAPNIPLSNCTTWYCLNLNYSVVEIISGNLTIIQKNIPVVEEELEERLTAVKHANGKDWWILVHQYGYGWPIAPCSNKFYKVLLTANGPQYMGEQDIGTLHCHFYSPAGELVFSRDGNTLAMAIPGQGTVDLFDFNRCTGNLNNYRALDVSDVLRDPYSCEFSSRSNLLYVSGFAIDNQVSGIGGLYQYNLNAADVSGSVVALWENSNPVIGAGQLQIAPNNKIYMAVYPPDTSALGSYISVINYPDSLGFASDFQLYGFYLGDSARSTFSLPNMPNYNLGPAGIYTIKAGLADTMVFCQDQSNGVMLGSLREDNVVYSWSPSFFLSDTNPAQPTASPTKDIWYYMTVRDTVSCNVERTDSVFVKVEDSCVTGIAYGSQHSVVRVFPNPANEVLSIECSVPGGCENYELRLFDILRRKVLIRELVDEKAKISIEHLENGAYFYMVGTSSAIFQIGKVLVIK